MAYLVSRRIDSEAPLMDGQQRMTDAMAALTASDTALRHINRAARQQARTPVAAPALTRARPGFRRDTRTATPLAARTATGFTRFTPREGAPITGRNDGATRFYRRGDLDRSFSMTARQRQTMRNLKMASALLFAGSAPAPRFTRGNVSVLDLAAYRARAVQIRMVANTDQGRMHHRFNMNKADLTPTDNRADLNRTHYARARGMANTLTI